jgi:hypothetical protein
MSKSRLKSIVLVCSMICARCAACRQPAGTRWARVADIIQYATLQWPAVQERIAKRKKSSGEATKVARKRKSSGGAGGSGRSSSKARLSASV